MVLQGELWCLRDEDLVGFSGDSEVRAATPWVRRKRLMVPRDLKLMESIVVELQEFVVHGSVAVKKGEIWIKVCGWLKIRRNENVLLGSVWVNECWMEWMLRQ